MEHLLQRKKTTKAKNNSTSASFSNSHIITNSFKDNLDDLRNIFKMKNGEIKKYMDANTEGTAFLRTLNSCKDGANIDEKKVYCALIFLYQHLMKNNMP